MLGGKSLLVFVLAALVQGSVVKRDDDDSLDVVLGQPITKLVQGLGLGASVQQALNMQCDCGACEGADPPAWLALVLRYGFSSCGGTLITDRHVLTSAHCVKGLEAPQVAVLLGAAAPRSQVLRDKPEAQPGEQLRLALRISRRSKLAVIKLDLPVTFSKTLAPVCLPAPAAKARKHERAEVSGMVLSDSRTLSLGALKKPGSVSRVDGREISFAPDDGVCLAFEGWPLVRKNVTNSKCELIGIQTEVAGNTKRNALESAQEKSISDSSEKSSKDSSEGSSDDSSADSSEERTTPTTTTTTTSPTTTTTTRTPGADCFGSTDFASVAHYLGWIREQTADATRCAPPNTSKEEQRMRQRWRSNMRSAARAAKKRANEQAKLKAAEKKANKKSREKREVFKGKSLSEIKNADRNLVTNARLKGEQRAFKKIMEVNAFRGEGASLDRQRPAAPNSATSDTTTTTTTSTTTAIPLLPFLRPESFWQ